MLQVAGVTGSASGVTGVIGRARAGEPLIADVTGDRCDERASGVTGGRCGGES